MIRIRSAVPDDLGAILRIESESFGIDAWSEDAFLPYFKTSPFLVASDTDTIVGYLVVFLRAGRPEIDSVAVLPSHRRRNVAERMLRRIIAQLRRKGYSSVYLSVRTSNEPALRLYRKLGFQRIRRIREYYDDGADAFRLKLSL